MPQRKEDEIMAEYLLKGGKMLEKCCTACGCPLFEYKGQTSCVVCAEYEQAKDVQKEPAGVAMPQKNFGRAGTAPLPATAFRDPETEAPTSAPWPPIQAQAPHLREYSLLYR